MYESESPEEGCFISKPPCNSLCLTPFPPWFFTTVLHRGLITSTSPLGLSDLRTSGLDLLPPAQLLK